MHQSLYKRLTKQVKMNISCILLFYKKCILTSQYPLQRGN